MSVQLLSAKQAARRLGISVATFYDWLAQSDHGQLIIRGQPVAIDYLQSGSKGQGRIRIEAGEVDRVIEAMRVHPRLVPERRPPRRRPSYPGIHVTLGDVAD